VGYIQYIDTDYINTLAKKGIVIYLEHKPSDFFWRNRVMALVWPANLVVLRVGAVQLDGKFPKLLNHYTTF
jgi:hypothetical protein